MLNENYQEEYDDDDENESKAIGTTYYGSHSSLSAQMPMHHIPSAPPSPQSCTAYGSHGKISLDMLDIPSAPKAKQDCVSYHDGLVYTTEATGINFPHLTDDNRNSDGKYSVCLTIPKSAPGIQAFSQAISAAKNEGIKKYGSFSPQHGGIRDGDKDRADYPEFAGKYFVNASSREKPQLIDADNNPLTTRDEINSNSVGVACLRFYPIKSSYNGEGKVEAIGCQIMGFMKVKDLSDAATGRENIDYFAGYRR